MTTKRVILIGCAGAFVLLGLAMACSVTCYRTLLKDPEGVAISIEGPRTVSLGEEFTIAVVVRNLREKDTFKVSSIDLGESYLDNFLILGSEPASKSDEHIPVDNTRSFTFDESIPALQQQRFEFRFRPTATGLFRGDVDVCEGARFLTTNLQTEVVESR